MKRFKVLLSFLLPYKWFAGQNIFFNILSTFFALFTYTLIRPFLKILFSQVSEVTHPGDFHFSKVWFEDILNYYISTSIVRKSHHV